MFPAGQLMTPNEVEGRWLCEYYRALLVEVCNREHSSTGLLGSVSLQNSTHLKEDSFIKAWLRLEALPFLFGGLCNPMLIILHLECCCYVKERLCRAVSSPGAPLLSEGFLSYSSLLHQPAASCLFSFSTTLALAVAPSALGRATASSAWTR